MQFPQASQSLNRYSYVLNNSLSLADPSGFFIDELFEEIDEFIGDAVQYVLDNPQVIAGIALGAATGFAVYGALAPTLGTAVAGAIAGGVGGFYSGLIAPPRRSGISGVVTSSGRSGNSRSSA